MKSSARKDEAFRQDDEDMKGKATSQQKGPSGYRAGDDVRSA